MWEFVVICFNFMLVLTPVMSSNITYTNITQVYYPEVDIEVDSLSLKHLFILSKTFVNLVLPSFSTIEDFLFKAVSGNSGFGAILPQWQTVVSYESGFVACVVVGLAFMLFFPIVGSIVCCCRTCNKCGGKMMQSHKRAKSKWRHFLCISLLILNTLIAIPCVFMFLTNQWTSQVIKTMPKTVTSTLGGVSIYTDSLFTQLEEMLLKYGEVDARLRERVENLGTSLGEPIQKKLTSLATPTLDDVSRLSSDRTILMDFLLKDNEAQNFLANRLHKITVNEENGKPIFEILKKSVKPRDDLKETLTALRTMEASTQALETGMTDLDSALNARRQALDNDLTNATCRSNIYCQAVRVSTTQLSTSGANFSSIASLQNEIKNIEDTLNKYDLNKEVSNVMGHLNNITQLINDTFRDPLLAALTQINDTLASSVSGFDVETLNEPKRKLLQGGSTVVNAIDYYSQNFDHYRNTGVLVLALMVAIIVALYFLGMILGTINFSSKPTHRSVSSNCGGIFIMAGVGFTFIFSWFLMIFVILLFTLGSHSERYLCQSLEPPYEGVRFIDRFFRDNGIEISGIGASISLQKLVADCENNSSIYEALGLEKVYNLPELIQNATNFADSFKNDLSNTSVDLSSIKIYSPQLEDALTSLKSSGLESIDFSSYTTQMSMGLTQVSLALYAKFLNDSADNMTSGSSSAQLQSTANEIRSHSFAILQIQSTRVDPLSETLNTLDNDLLVVRNVSAGFNKTIDAVATGLQHVDAYISTNASQFVVNMALALADLFLSDISGYVAWLLQQITHNYGACRPLYVVYANSVSLVCDHFVSILNGLWFSLGWCLFVLIPATVVGMKVAKFFRKMKDDIEYDKEWADMEMDAMNPTSFDAIIAPPGRVSVSMTSGQSFVRYQESFFSNSQMEQHRKSTKVLPGEYY